MADAYLAAVAYALPERVVANETLAAENPTWDMPRIIGKVGIRERHVASSHETSADLAHRAAEKLFASGAVERGAIDALLFCTQTPDYVLPASACVLQHRLGLGVDVAAFDYNQGCSGYVYGLGIAKGLVAAGIARNVLLLTGETYSKLIHPLDRTVRVLFGDAGSASLISADPGGARIGATVLGTDGSGADNLIVRAGGFRRPRDADAELERVDEIGCVRTDAHLHMDGKAITTFALQRVPALLDRLVQAGETSVEQVDWFVFHQANAFMNERLRARLNVPAAKAPMCIESVGNTVGNTIPIVLREHASRFQPGERVAAVGFGVGYSWGGTLLDWGDVTLA